MSDRAAITGSLVDAKNIAVHKSVRLSIDVPAELGAEIIKMFGWPTMAAPVTVAVARLGAAPQIEARAENVVEMPRRWSTLTPAAQAGIRCAEPAFQKYLREVGDSNVADETTAATYVRFACGVNSRADLKGTSAKKWAEIDSGYHAWMQVPTE